MKNTSHLEPIPYSLIIDYLDGNISVDDQNTMQLWIDASVENVKIYEEIVSIYNDLDLLSEYKKLNIQQSWNNLESKLNIQKNDTSTNPQIVKKPVKLWFSIAAAVLLLVSFWLYYSDSIASSQIVSTSPSERKTIVLPDGTKAFLNANTEITYNKSSFLTKRNLILKKGEIFLIVVHNQSAPFTVRADELNIKDIGTSFNVKKSDKQIEIIVKTGIVALQTIKNDQTKKIIKANGKAIFDVEANEINVGQNTDINYQSWVDKNFHFINTPLIDVVNKISSVYGVDISLQDTTLKSRRLTATFKNQQIDSVLTIITTSLQLNMEKKNGKYLIKK